MWLLWSVQRVQCGDILDHTLMVPECDMLISFFCFVCRWFLVCLCDLYIQSSAVITQSNWSWYCIWHCNNRSRKWITTDTPYLTLTGKPLGVYCEDFGENRPSYNGTTLYIYIYYIYISFHLLHWDIAVTWLPQGEFNHRTLKIDWYFMDNSVHDVNAIFMQYNLPLGQIYIAFIS